MCHVYCYGKKACQNAIITVPSDANAEVYCGGDGTEQCKGAQIIIPPPNTPETHAVYDFLCFADRSCVQTTFEFAEFLYFSEYSRTARLICRGDSCGDTTQTICPWDDTYPDECFSRSNLMEPTPSPTATTINPTPLVPGTTKTTETETTIEPTSSPTDITLLPTITNPTPAPSGWQNFLCGDAARNGSKCLDNIVCNEGCKVFCIGDGACKGKNITANFEYILDVYCFGDGACEDTIITLPSDSLAEIFCGDGAKDTGACKGSHMIIPPPQTTYLPAYYSISCYGNQACTQTTFEFVDFNTSASDSWEREADITCNKAANGGDYSCDDSTQTICPWEDTYPDACFDIIGKTFAPTPSPTPSNTIVCESDGDNNKCISPVVCERDCNVFCLGSGACKGFNISCHSSSNCDVGCYGDGACEDAVITVPSDLWGDVFCGNGAEDTGACKGAHVLIPPPQDKFTAGFYVFECLGNAACFNTTFEFVDFDTSSIEGWPRGAIIRCNIGLNDTHFACDDSTRTICPWNDTYPGECFNRQDTSFIPTKSPTPAPTPAPVPTPAPTGSKKEDNTGKIVGGVVGGLCGVGIIVIIAVFCVKYKNEGERSYDRVSGIDA